MSDVDALVSQALADFAAVTDGAALENAKARYLGRSGLVTDLLKVLGKLPADLGGNDRIWTVFNRRFHRGRRNKK